MSGPEDDRVDLAAVAAELFGVRPEEFVAARGAAVKRLRAAKARDAAAEVAGWRRPSVADWALNLAAREAESPVAAFLEAAAAARDAQAAALAGREVPGGLRAAVSEVRAGVGPRSCGRRRGRSSPTVDPPARRRWRWQSTRRGGNQPGAGRAAASRLPGGG